jgi:hypothetical protein
MEDDGCLWQRRADTFNDVTPTRLSKRIDSNPVHTSGGPTQNRSFP